MNPELLFIIVWIASAILTAVRLHFSSLKGEEYTVAVIVLSMLGPLGLILSLFPLIWRGFLLAVFYTAWFFIFLYLLADALFWYFYCKVAGHKWKRDSDKAPEFPLEEHETRTCKRCYEFETYLNNEWRGPNGTETY